LGVSLTFLITRSYPAYDTLFIAAAQREGCPVAIFDQRLQDAFPDWILAPGSLLA